MSGVERIGAVVHPGRAGALTLGKELGRWACDHGIELRTLHAEHGCLGADTQPCAEADLAKGCDLMVALGGDGTLLRAARLALEEEVPILGVNLGRLGFLTEVEPGELTAALEAFLAGGYHIDRRTTLEVTTAGGEKAPLVAHAINDLVLEKAARQRLAGVGVWIDGVLFARYAADGLIVATPTGSTAYSFSAGGPIVVPQLEAIMLTPIAPHMVFNRPLVLHPDQTLTLEVLPESSGVQVDVDGRALRRLAPGATVQVRRGPRQALLVRLDGNDFFRRVRSKFQLADAGVTGELPGQDDPEDDPGAPG